MRFDDGDESLTLWGKTDHVNVTFLHKSYSQCRDQAVSILCELKTEVEVCNDRHPELPFYLETDLTDDVTEREVGMKLKITKTSTTAPALRHVLFPTVVQA